MIYLGNGIYSDSGPDTLAHYGVLGMKWGVRKARNEQNLFNRELRDFRKHNLREDYRGGKISKERYKKLKENYKLEYKRNKAAANIERLKKIAEYKNDPDKFKKKYGDTRHNINNRAKRRELDKRVPGYADWNKHIDTARTLAGGISGPVTAFFGPAVGTAAGVGAAGIYAAANHKNINKSYDKYNKELEKKYGRHAKSVK